MFIERRKDLRRSLLDLRSWEERRRPEWRRRFTSETDKDLRSGNDQRQDTRRIEIRRIEIRRLGLDRRAWEFCEETCYS